MARAGNAADLAVKLPEAAEALPDAARVKAAELAQEAERRAAEHQALVAAAKQELAQIAAGIEAKAGELASMRSARL